MACINRALRVLLRLGLWGVKTVAIGWKQAGKTVSRVGTSKPATATFPETIVRFNFSWQHKEPIIYTVYAVLFFEQCAATSLH